MSKSTWRDDGRGYARIRYLVRVTDRPGGSAHWLTKQRHARVLVFAPAGRRTSRSGTQAILKSWWKSHLLPGWQRKVATWATQGVWGGRRRGCMHANRPLDARPAVVGQPRPRAAQRDTPHGAACPRADPLRAEPALADGAAHFVPGAVRAVSAEGVLCFEPCMRGRVGWGIRAGKLEEMRKSGEMGGGGGGGWVVRVDGGGGGVGDSARAGGLVL